MKKKSFEEAVARLEEIVVQMEGGTISLEKSVAAFKEGMQLIKLCKSL